MREKAGEYATYKETKAQVRQTCWHQDKAVFFQQRRIDGLPLVLAKHLETEHALEGFQQGRAVLVLPVKLAS